MKITDYGTWLKLLYIKHNDNNVHTMYLEDTMPLTKDNIKKYLPDCKVFYIDNYVVNSKRQPSNKRIMAAAAAHNTTIHQWIYIETL